MSRLNRSLRRRAIVGLLVAAGSPAMASTAQPAAAAAGPPTSSAATPPFDTPATPQDGLIGNLLCTLNEYNPGPLGPMGPWGPLGPLHNKPHPACVGGGPDFK